MKEVLGLELTEGATVNQRGTNGNMLLLLRLAVVDKEFSLLRRLLSQRAAL